MASPCKGCPELELMEFGSAYRVVGGGYITTEPIYICKAGVCNKTEKQRKHFGREATNDKDR